MKVNASSHAAWGIYRELFDWLLIPLRCIIFHPDFRVAFFGFTHICRYYGTVEDVRGPEQRLFTTSRDNRLRTQ